MPEMDGIEFLAVIREHYPEVPFVLFTGTDERAAAERVRERDATYLRKSGGDGYRQLQAHVAAVVADD
jgi:CheY-like chemotaxis protein